MLEAAIQKGELGEGGYETWVLLGETRSMDEREDLGLLALRQGVKIAKEAGAVGPGMLVCSQGFLDRTLGELLTDFFSSSHWLCLIRTNPMRQLRTSLSEIGLWPGIPTRL